jgi:hypothetical protein
MVVVNVGGEKKNCVQKKNQINKTEKKKTKNTKRWLKKGSEWDI